MYLILVAYIALILVFLIMCGLIFRHTVKYGYLSPKFKSVALTFGVIALIVILISAYFMFKLLTGQPSSSTFSPGISTPSEIQF